jgi:farnesyl diphosphate synthase
LLVLATAEAVGDASSGSAALHAACAIELIHAYSLVHDDMPCMDNDVLRRGKPTVHVQFGEAQALLAGDALQTLAFEMLTPQDASVSAAEQAACVGLLARASGYQGMAGGQAIDLASVGQRLTEDQLRQMHRLKTGALLLCSVQMGAACVQGVPAPVHEALTRFGEALGLAFQVVDDVLDVTADSVTLGKTAGKDEAADKPTYVALMGLDAAKAYADALAAQAMQALADTGLPEARLAPLRGLTTMVVNRNN